MAVSGETSLKALLQSLTVSLHPSTFTFLTLPASYAEPITYNPADDLVHLIFREPGEGTTLIIDNKSSDAAQSLAQKDYTQVDGAEASPMQWKKLTLNVHSSLEAVGFMGVISAALAEAQVSCNVVAGWYHDHVFVQADKAEAAVKAVEEVARQAQL